jgi:hypothetical protein
MEYWSEPGEDNDWVQFEQFDAVATDLLFAQEVYVNKTLNVGSADGSSIIIINPDSGSYDNPYISIGQNPIGFNNNGIYLGFSNSTASLSLVSGNKGMKWDGSNLYITGGIIQNSSSGDLIIDSDGITLRQRVSAGSIETDERRMYSWTDTDPSNLPLRTAITSYADAAGTGGKAVDITGFSTGSYMRLSVRRDLLDKQDLTLAIAAQNNQFISGSTPGVNGSTPGDVIMSVSDGRIWLRPGSNKSTNIVGTLIATGSVQITGSFNMSGASAVLNSGELYINRNNSNLLYIGPNIINTKNIFLVNTDYFKLTNSGSYLTLGGPDASNIEFITGSLSFWSIDADAPSKITIIPSRFNNGNPTLTLPSSSGTLALTSQIVATNLTTGSTGTTLAISSSTGTHTLIPTASITTAGIITTAEQTIGGIKNFVGGIRIKSYNNSGYGSIRTSNLTSTQEYTIPSVNSCDFVMTLGNQTIGGNKTFLNTITGSISGNAATVTNGVYTTGNQTIGGNKTFSNVITGSISGNAATATSATSAGSADISNATVQSVTFNNGGAGAASGTAFNGGTARIISYNTIGAPSTTGTNASGTWNIGITGNAATVTNGVYTTGNQTIGGTKTFSSNPKVSSTNANSGSYPYVEFSHTGNGVARVGGGDGLYLVSNSTVRLRITNGGDIIPGSNNTGKIGNASTRWTEIFATNGTINTSDETEKTNITELSDAERQVATSLKGLIRKYQWIDAIEKKGEDDARIHVGVIAQDVALAFENAGLNPERYGVFCKDIWYTKEEVYIEQINNPNFDESQEESADNVREINGETKIRIVHCASDDEGAIQHTQYGVRYNQLWAFIISAL